MAKYLVCDQSNLVRLSSISSIYQNSKNSVLIFTGTETPVKLKTVERYSVQEIARILSVAETIDQDFTTWDEAVQGFLLAERLKKVFDSTDDKRSLQNPEVAEKLDKAVASIDAGETKPRHRRH